jgi:formylglycine-generating enzyme required for sulfatase activity
MEQGFIDILQKLIAEQGKETLLNASKCKPLLADYTRNEYKKESRLLLQALEAGVQKAIDTSQELPICKKQQIRLLHEDYGLDEKVAADIIDTLALVLRGDTAKTEIQSTSRATAGEPSVKPSFTAAITAPVVPGVEPLMKRGWLFLEDSDWEKANEYFDKVLDMDPEYAPAYIGKLCAELKVRQEDQLVQNKEPLVNNKHYQKAVRFADVDYRVKLEQYNKIIQDRVAEEERLERDRQAKANQLEEERLESVYAMVRVPSGSFQMGDTASSGRDNERPVHTVTLSAFYIGKYEVTQALYKSIMRDNPSKFKGGNLPVEQVSWYDAIEFCNKLSEMEGLTPYYTINKTDGSDVNNTSSYDKLKWLVTRNTSANGYRLPTEAEWEYVAKGGNGSPGNYMYSGSNNIDSVAWYDGNSGSTSHAVGTKAPNDLGIYDMSGNVWEWCWDWYGNYSSGTQTDPTGMSSGSFRVLRGGSWGHSAQFARFTYRDIGNPSYQYYNLGFRLVRP